MLGRYAQRSNGTRTAPRRCLSLATRPNATADAWPATHWADQIYKTGVRYKDAQFAQQLYDRVMRSPRAKRKAVYSRLRRAYAGISGAAPLPLDG